jgi:hypothetical protein
MGSAASGGTASGLAGPRFAADQPAADRSAADRPPDNVVAARVVAVRGTATGCLVSVDAGGLTALLPRAYGNGQRPAPGAAVELVIPAASVHVIPDRQP